MTENPFLQAALKYASQYHWRVFPLKPRDKTPVVKWADTATTAIDDVLDLWGAQPTANVGVVCGARSGIVVLDIDAGHGGEQSLMQLQVNYGKLPDTMTTRTGGGGRHMIFLHPGVEIHNSAGKLGPGLDIRGDGGYIVAPPSIHPSGSAYEWLNTMPPAGMPAWLVSLLRDPQPPAAPQHTTAGEIPKKITLGGRNQTLASLAGSMRRRGMDVDSIYAALQTENAKRCDPPLSETEVMTIAKSIQRYVPTAPPMPRGEEKVEAREPLDAYQGVGAFLDLLDHLEGRSIKTGIVPLDKSIGGLERQTLSILAARPSMGKSTLAWQIGRNVAAAHLKTYFFSLEMSTASLWAKAACGMAGIRWRDIRAGEASQSDIDRVIGCATELMEVYGDRLLVDDGVNTSEAIWQSVEKHRPDLVIIDHLRLVADREENEVKRLGIITQRFKDMAKAFNCHVLCLAQLNRGVEAKENKRPQLADLRDSGQIEENADAVAMLYRDDYYDPPAGKPPMNSETEVLIRKFRDDIGNQRVNLLFDTKHQWFEGKGNG